MTGRLDKIISALALLTRSEAQAAIRGGRAAVDGEICRDCAKKTDTESHEVTLDGMRLAGDGYIYIVMNKPRGVLSATRDGRERVVTDLLPEEYARAGLSIAGRLDKDSHGLVLLTDNGELCHRIISPRYKEEKIYRVELDLPADGEDAAAFAAGMDLGDFISMPARLEPDGRDARICTVTLREGKYHQIKRMFAARGKTVTDLQRLRIGRLTLETIEREGMWRRLTQEEAEKLKADVKIM
ncbi:MAG: rRNA pseudouridine synthase [Clostridia bacterium]|nr:rRNA pseudouridine synthase [Clostridia bacterium]